MASGFKAAVLFDNLGPYHLARLRAAASVAEVSAVEFGARSVDYRWEGPGAGVRVETVNPHGSSWELSWRGFREGLGRCLENIRPDVVFVPGWATPGAMLALSWCLKNGVPAVAMSESTAWDAPRVAAREALKRWVVSRFSAALVGGQPQRDYVLELGMPAGRVFTGYNIVDNAYFVAGSDRERRCAPEDRRSEMGDGRPPMADGGWRMAEGGAYFLASSRFVPKKNLFALLEGYAGYCAACAAQDMEDRRWKIGGSGERGAGSGEKREGGWVWPLVLLGDGELRGELVGRIRELGLRVEFRAPWEEAGRGAPGDRRLEIGDRMEADGGGMADGGGWRGDGGEGMAGRVAPGDRRSETGERRAENGVAHGGSGGGKMGVVFLPGFRQVGELPRFYAGAGAFVHASLSEQWGLVVNEAMACALPVLVSDRCGCAKDLVHDGVNGYTFVVSPMAQLADKFSRMASMPAAERVQMGLRGREMIVRGWGDGAFAQGFLGAAKAALAAPRRGGRFFSRAVLEAFAARQLG